MGFISLIFQKLDFELSVFIPFENTFFIYHLTMNEQSIQSFLVANDTKSLQDKCEQLELESAVDSSLPKYSFQLLTYLINNETDRARLLWKINDQKYFNLLKVDHLIHQMDY